ncbi:MAG: hypothetical protein ACR2MU_01775 [Gaiellaceae bacterium]
MNPSGRVPTLEDGELVLTESAAILLTWRIGFPRRGSRPRSASAQSSTAGFSSSRTRSSLP